MQNPLGRTSTDARAAGDAARRRAAVVATGTGAWRVHGHPETVAVATDPGRFSSAVSSHLQLPNGLDGEEHRRFRAVVDHFFSPGRMAEALPAVQAVARDLVAELAAAAGAERPDGPREVRLDAVADLGSPFAVRAQARWLGWPASLEPRLLAWMGENHEASRGGDGDRLRAVADDFDAIIRSVIAPRRQAGKAASADVTTALVHDETLGRPLTDEEIVSILRNWTAGDLGSMALCVGVVVAFLAEHEDVAARIRTGASDVEVDAILDEILRIDDPFLSNRRVATCPVHLAGVDLEVGDRVVIDWTSANRDERVFADPDRFDPEEHADANLVWGIGPHVCPGRPLATLELRVLIRELLGAFSSIVLDADAPAVREVAPLGGFASVGVILGR